MADRPIPFHGEPPQPGHHYEAVAERADWAVMDGTEKANRCRSAQFHHRACGQPAVIKVLRSRYRANPTWWAYCAEHAYGRWIEDGHVMHWMQQSDDGQVPANPKEIATADSLRERAIARAASEYDAALEPDLRELHGPALGIGQAVLRNSKQFQAAVDGVLAEVRAELFALGKRYPDGSAWALTFADRIAPEGDRHG